MNEEFERTVLDQDILLVLGLKVLFHKIKYKLLLNIHTHYTNPYLPTYFKEGYFLWNSLSAKAPFEPDVEARCSGIYQSG